ncbi:MAG: L-arabinose isomerase [Clostridia bacterium]|nr:L-arabinose isomerase [Clostridia bacterium]
MKKVYFITGSQDLYGEECLRDVARDSKVIADYLAKKIDTVEIEYLGIVRDEKSCVELCKKATNDEDCIAVITWMHTFSPAKMWIKGLQLLTKPLLHFHTQANEKLPYDEIDMDFMNLNQTAHGGREYGFMCTRLGVKREVIVGYYEHEEVIEKIKKFLDVARAVDFSKNLNVCMFGSNMREVSVTDGDRVESQIKYGWNVNYYGIGDLVALVNEVTDKELNDKIDEYKKLYIMNTDNLEAVKEQAKYEIALDKFLTEGNFGAYTDTFQDLHGMRQLPGLATQRMMAKGTGFGAEGDYKTAALNAIFCEMAKGRAGSTGFMEDYTYDFTRGDEVVLGSHMLEVSPDFASTQPKIEVHHLGIGGKEPPARLVFDGVEGDGVAVCMIDMGNRFRLICASIELVKQPKPMPKLPVARIMWKLKPNHQAGAAAWIYAGGAHHTVVSTALTVEDIKLFAKLTDTELVVIDENTDLYKLQQELDMLDLISKLK